MKKTGAFRKALYTFSGWAYGGVGVMAALLAYMNDIDGKESWISNRPVVLMFIEKVQEYSFVAYVLFGFLLISFWIVRSLGDPWVIEKIQYILDRYQDQVFGGNETPSDHERVTIFQYKKFCFLRSHWSKKWFLPVRPHHFVGSYLVPYLRSGHLSKKTKTCFWVPDDSDRSEGVAALAWTRRKAVLQRELPQIHSTSSDNNIRKYSDRTNCPFDMVKCYKLAGKILPRSLAAIPLEKNGKMWGVLVIDSRSPDGVTDQAIYDYSLTIGLIGQLLERA